MKSKSSGYNYVDPELDFGCPVNVRTMKLKHVKTNEIVLNRVPIFY